MSAKTREETQWEDKFPLSDSAKQVFERARQQSQRLNHNYVGTEHLLLGLVTDPEDPACQMLESLGVSQRNVTSAVEFIIGRGNKAVLGEISLTPRVKKVIELSRDVANKFRHSEINSVDLLLGLVREGEGIAAGVLESLGVNNERIYAEVSKLDLLSADELKEKAEKARAQPDFGRPVDFEFETESGVSVKVIALAILVFVLLLWLWKRR